MKKLLLLLLALFSLNVLEAQLLIALQHEGQSSFFTNIQPALDAAADGDTIYLPGGNFSQIIMNKRLHLIGVGINQDSSLATGVCSVQNMTITSEASGGSMTGIFIQGGFQIGNTNDDNDVDGFSISRCSLLYGLFFNPYLNSENNSRKFSITESYIGGANGCGTCSNWNAFQGGYFVEEFYVSNNVITAPFGLNHSEISNNIIVSQHQVGGENSTFRNNILSISACCYAEAGFWYNNFGSLSTQVNTVHQSGQGTGNVAVNPIETLFLNFANGDYHLTNPNLYIGTDGTQIGIYGGAFPWKPGSVPYNPHIQTKIIAPTTNAQGNLNVQIRAAAQEH